MSVKSRIISTEDIQQENDELAEHPPVSGIINSIQSKHFDNEPDPQFSIRFQIMATFLIVSSALTGSFLGIILSEENAGADLISWIALPGDLFIRALKAIVLPLVFVNVILAVMQMAEAGKAGKVGSVTVGVYLVTTLMAGIEGLVIVSIFKEFYSEKEGEIDETFIQFVCPQSNFVLAQLNEELACVNQSLINNEANFELVNVNNFFRTIEDETATLSFSETLQNNVFKQLVPENIVAEFANSGFVGVVMFGILFGAASQQLQRAPALLLNFLKDINDILVNIIEWIIVLTPFAVMSLIAGALGAQENLPDTFKDIGILLGTVIAADVLHLFIVYPLVFFLIVRRNPFAYLKFILPAQFFAFASASSAATLPVNLKCVKNSRQVPDSIRDFVLPIGATINMDGVALYFPAALVFLATASGIETGPAEYFLILIVSTVGSAGAAPVPNAGLVLLLTAFSTVYGGGTPSSFGILFGIDWLVDRMQTVMNITGDAMVARIVTHLSGLNITDDRPTSLLEVEKHDEEHAE